MNEMPKPDGDDHLPLRPVTASEIEAKFDAGEDVSDYVDWESGAWVKNVAPMRERKGVFAGGSRTVDDGGAETDQTEGASVRVVLPPWAHERLETEAGQHGISQEELVRLLILQQLALEKIVL